MPFPPGHLWVQHWEERSRAPSSEALQVCSLQLLWTSKQELVGFLSSVAPADTCKVFSLSRTRWGDPPAETKGIKNSKDHRRAASSLAPSTGFCCRSSVVLGAAGSWMGRDRSPGGHRAVAAAATQ